MRANCQNQYSAITSGGATIGSFTYDANGNLTGETNVFGTRNYVYDVENRLVSAGGAASASLVYDPLGRLFEVGGNAGVTRFLYDGDALVAEYDGSGALTRRYVHGPGADEPVAVYDGPALGVTTRRYMLADERGSIVGLVHANGWPSAYNSYDEYGFPGAANSGRFQYTGQIWIPELGLYHYKARLYSPALGRFLQVDPIGYEDQINLYAYVGNDPVNQFDPTGTFEIKARSEGSVGPLEDAINALASNKYAFDANRMLMKVGPSENSGRTSETYSETIDRMIESPIRLELSVQDVISVNGVVTDLSTYGGGVTFGPENSTDSILTAISGKSFVGVPGVGGTTLHQSPAEILMHEIVSEAAPFALGAPPAPGSIKRENQIRNELWLIRREKDKDHYD